MAGTTSSPFSRAVVNAMRKLYPESLADSSWDNTGLLLEAPFDPLRRQTNSALLTIDLTRAVADEAIARNDSIIIAYHPIIFRGLKSLTLSNTQQSTLLRLAAAGISVYSPHTALDAAPGGLGDWLADIVTGTAPSSASAGPSSPAAKPQDADDDDPFVVKRPSFKLHHASASTVPLQSPAVAAHSRAPIVPSSVAGYDPATTGMGRVVRFAAPQPLLDVVERISAGLGRPKGFPIAVPQGQNVQDMEIRSVAVCAGSGGGVFGQLKDGDEVDLLLTGEMSHHEALAAIEKGQVVISLFHSNTERGFLQVLKGQLEEAVGEEWGRMRTEGSEKEREDGGEVWTDEGVEIHVSEVDRDPYGILISREDHE